MSRWFKYDVADVSLEFGTDTVNGKVGLKPDRKRRGDNNIFLLPAVDSKSTVKKLTSDASFALLSVVYILTGFMGRHLESLLGLFLLFTLFCISLAVQNASSKRRVNSYRLLLPSSKVIENGNRIKLSIFDVEVGDLIEFSQGDVIPADARIVFADHLTVAERYIEPISGKIAYRREEKNSDSLPDLEEGMDTYANVVYAASIVTSGKGKAIVTETGAHTKFSTNKTGMSIISGNDVPEYFACFSASAKRISLFAFFSVIPLTIISLIRQSPIPSDSSDFDLLYAFLLMLSISVTCMSEFIISPAESLLTKDLLISSRKGKAKKNADSRITKLLSAETVADIDTVLILSPEVLTDNRHHLRRIYFADKRYRFDTLKSKDLFSFFELTAPILSYSNIESLSKDMIAFNAFLADNDIKSDIGSYSTRPRFLRNYPETGARACVFDSDENGNPDNYIFYTNKPALVYQCSHFRTEGGGVWKLDRDVLDRISLEYDEYIKFGLSPVIFISSNDNILIFEGMIGVGIEYPFADGTLSEEFCLSGIQPILFFEKESSSNLTTVLECGLISNKTDIAMYSEYSKNGMDIADAPIATKAYIGFDRKNLSKITDRLIRNGRKILPIIRDSVDRRGIAPISVYGVHSTDSYDSVKIASSVSLQPADADIRKGGAYDILKIIRGSSIARLKLGVYKNYLAFAMFLRSVAFCCSLLFGKSGSGITSLMILASGFICDFIAAISLLGFKGIPVKPKEAASDSKMMFSSTLFLVFSIAGVFSGVAVFGITELLLMLGKLPVSFASTFLGYSVFFSQLISFGGILIILNKHTRQKVFNWIYLLLLIAISAILISQSFLPESVFRFLHHFKVYRLDFGIIPFVYLASFLTFVVILLISKIISVFSNSNIK